MLAGIAVLAWAGTDFVRAQEKSDAGQAPLASTPASAPAAVAPAAKTGGGKQAAISAAAAEQQDLQKAIEQASNDRAALMHNLLDFLKKYPQTAQRAQIYRAIVESSLQLRDFPTATEYAERMVSLNPGDAPTNLLAIQLLERYGDASGWRRAVNYCARVLEIVHRESATQKSPRQSSEQFEKDRQHDVAAVLLVRGQLYKS